MFSPIEKFCIAWSALSAGWFIYAAILVFQDKRKFSISTGSNLPSMTIFKPLPPVGETGVPMQLARALESFIRQMDCRTDMLLGIDEAEFPLWQKIIDRWQDQFPAARLQAIRHPKPDSFANPKISWQIVLARHATGELWLWSDADIEAPEGFLNSVRAELVHSKCRAITSPYSVRVVPGACNLLDALFVNVEFYPGVLLLQRRREVRFALGAATLFRAEDFRRKTDWGKLGSTLADDNELGRQLAPIEVSRNTVETLPQEKNFRGAFLHYLRWHKTIRWCEPAGYAGQLVLLPILGWIFCLALNPLGAAAWIGLAATGLFEILIAALIFGRLKCTVPFRRHWMIVAWTALRPAAWILSWAPGPVRWHGCRRRWLGLRKLELFERS
jgi:ceramide glucosyltransferase